MFEIHILSEIIDQAIINNDAVRENLSVLSHLVQQNELKANTMQAIWLGTKIGGCYSEFHSHVNKIDHSRTGLMIKKTIF